MQEVPSKLGISAQPWYLQAQVSSMCVNEVMTMQSCHAAFVVLRIVDATHIVNRLCTPGARFSTAVIPAMYPLCSAFAAPCKLHVHPMHPLAFSIDRLEVAARTQPALKAQPRP